MIYLILAVLLNTSVFICFKYFEFFRVPIFQAIVTNYLVCIITGVIYLGGPNTLLPLPLREPWFWVASGLGVVFIATFYLMAIATQRVGVILTSVSNKMSMVFSVVAGLLFFEQVQQGFSIGKAAGILLAVLAIILTSQKAKKAKLVASKRYLFLPFAIFLLGGLLETVLGYTQRFMLPKGFDSQMTIFIFLAAGITGGAFALTQQIKYRQGWSGKALLGGLILGVPNYFSIYTIIMALDAFEGNIIMVFPVVNVGTILFSTLCSFILFGERLIAANWAGIAAAVAAIILITFY